MFNRQKNKLNIQEIASKLREISYKLDQLEQSNRQDIYIETLNIDRPSLEKLSFTLDKLDIKELSGSLNLGNNFGTQIGQDILKGLQKANKDSKTTEQTGGSRVKKTSSGFSVHL